MQGRQWDGSPRTERQLEQKIIEIDTDVKRIWKRLQDLFSALGSPPGDTTGSFGGTVFMGGAGGELLDFGLGKTDASVTAGGSVTVSVYTPGTSPVTDADSGDNITCSARTDIDAGVFVNWIDRGNYYECFPLECNA